MRIVSEAMQAHMQEQVTTLTLCVQIQCSDGLMQGFTSCDRPLTIDGLVYQPNDSLNISAIETTSDWRSDTLDVQGIINSTAITADALLAGRYDRARVIMALVNYQQLPETLLSNDVIRLYTGFIGEVRQQQGQFVAVLESFSVALQRATLDVYAPSCRAQQLGDAACKVNISSYTHFHTVASIVNERTITHSGTQRPDGYFIFGLLRWQNGQNAGLSQTIRDYQSGVLTLDTPPYYPPQAGDSIRLIRGCDRQFATCRDVFQNVANFRGEPPHLLPGLDRLSNPV